MKLPSISLPELPTPLKPTEQTPVAIRQPEHAPLSPLSPLRPASPEDLTLRHLQNRYQQGDIAALLAARALQRGGQPPTLRPGLPPGYIPPYSALRQPSARLNPPIRRSKHFPLWVRMLLGLLITLLLLTGSVFAYYEIKIAPALNTILGNQARRHYVQSQPTHSIKPSQINSTPLSSRINILLLGSDTDGKDNDPETGGQPLAQTVMVITIDPHTKYVGMLSIPRDMQVYERGYIAPKLDEVFMHAFSGATIAESVGQAAGHMMDILEENYGIHIDHYAWAGLQGFIKVINTAGGVDVDVIHPMVDDTYPDDITIHQEQVDIHAYKRIYIAPGPQHLNGRQALEYVRTRHSDLIGDFGRTIRQQQVLGQLKEKLTASDVLGKAADYLQDLSGSLYTDMNLADIIGMGSYLRGIDLTRIERVSLAPPLYATEGEQRYGNYIPRCAAINQIVQKMFGTAATPNCLAQAYMHRSTDTATARTAAITRIGNEQIMTNGGIALPFEKLAHLSSCIRNLLSILLTTIFESPEALQINGN